MLKLPPSDLRLSNLARNRPRNRPIVQFEESFAGGFFNFARTYGAVARFEAESVEALEADWPAALQETAQWRARRGERAVSLHLHVVVPLALAWDAVAFLSRNLLASPASFPTEFAGLRVEPVVFAAPGMEVYVGMTINSEATAHIRRDDG